LTITSSAKDAPVWGTDGRVYYLDSGKLVATAPGASGDADAVFPVADLRLRLGPLFGGDARFSAGGLEAGLPSPDGKTVAGVLRLETGRALLLAPAEENVPLVAAAFGADIKVAWLKDNTLLALIRGGAPPPQPAVLLNEAALAEPQSSCPALPPVTGAETHFVIRLSPDGRILSGFPLPLAPNGMAVSPDNKRVVLALDEGDTVGLALLPLDGSSTGPVVVYEKPAHSPALVAGRQDHRLCVRQRHLRPFTRPHNRRADGRAREPDPRPGPQHLTGLVAGHDDRHAANGERRDGGK
jgi:hypothetical protein